MSFLTTSFGGFGHSRSGLAGQLGAGVGTIADKVRATWTQRRTNRILAALSDRELDDIGLSRADLPLSAAKMRRRVGEGLSYRSAS